LSVLSMDVSFSFLYVSDSRESATLFTRCSTAR
jgi:hypothetical protein